jgi:hypothetical protein
MRIGSIFSMLVEKRKHVDNRSVYNSSRELDFVTYANCKYTAFPPVRRYSLTPESVLVSGLFLKKVYLITARSPVIQNPKSKIQNLY